MYLTRNDREVRNRHRHFTVSCVLQTSRTADGAHQYSKVLMWCASIALRASSSSLAPQGRDRPRCERPSTRVERIVHRRAHTGLRLADKRSLPCPRRAHWLAARDELYEEIMAKAWNADGQFFAQSYEDLDILDSSLLIMPLVFFMSPVRLRASPCAWPRR